MASEFQVPPAAALGQRVWRVSLALVLTLAADPALAGTLAQKPLFLGVAAPPNVILGVDDSARMMYEVAMASGEDGYTVDEARGARRNVLFPDGHHAAVGGDSASATDAVITANLPPLPFYADARSPVTNRAYFDPWATYAPWPSYGDAVLAPADPSAARWYPVPGKNVHPDQWMEPACLSPTPAGMPDLYDLTRAIRCSGPGYTFNAGNDAGGVPLPVGTEFKPSDPAYAAPEGVACDTATGWCLNRSKDDLWITDARLAIGYFPATFYLPAGTPSPYPSYLPGKIATSAEAFRAYPPGALPTGVPWDGRSWDRYEIRPEHFTDPAEYARAIQNFANWFTYARKRGAATLGAIGAAFKDIQNMRLGVFNLGLAERPFAPLALTDLSNVAETHRLFAGGSGLYALEFGGAASIPRAVDYMGKQFQQSDAIEYACQKNVGLLFTDGGGDAAGYDPALFSPGLGNVDGGAGPPFADAASDTLADIAMYYYRTNLSPGLPAGLVPTPAACDGPNPGPALDCQKNPHMNFYAVSLGATGRLYNPDNPSDPEAIPDPFNPPPGKSPMPWPSNEALRSSAADRLDDLWHGTLNARGRLLTAHRPAEIRDRLLDILTTITDRSGAGAAGATNSAYLGADTLLFQASFDSAHWSGELAAYRFADGAVDTSTPVWKASEGVPDPSSRNVVTYSPAGSHCGTQLAARGIPFDWDALNCSQRARLDTLDGAADGLGRDRLAYLKGDTSREERHGGPFRDRVDATGKAVRLGDFIGSSPAYAGTEDYGYSRLDARAGGTTYPSFLAGKTDRVRAVYIGGNDGMLHAFDAANGKELFAYVPNGVFGHLSLLTSPQYGPNTHRYFVDGSPWVGDAYFGGGWKTVLVGTTGAGGRSLFALDVSDPDRFSANRVLWEIDGDANRLPNLGYTLPQPALVRTRSSEYPWVVIAANGYHSPGGKAVLLIIDLETGAVIKEIDTRAGGNATAHPPGPVARNGLSTPIVVDIDQDRIADLVYAGDLLGNVWKFDLTSARVGDWKVSYGSEAQPAPLFVACANHAATACAARDRQPITAKPVVARASESLGGLMVFVGTGKYFEDGDNLVGDHPQTQSLYGLWDLNGGGSGDVVGPASLVRQTIDGEAALNGRTVRYTSANAVAYPARRGWYMDLQPNGGPPAGERVTSAPVLHGHRIAFTSFTPATAVCASGGSGWLMELDAATGASGGRTVHPAFDVSADGRLDIADLATVDDRLAAPAALKLNGIPFAPRILRDADAVYRITRLSDGGTRVEKGAPGDDRNTRTSWRQIR